MNTKKLYPLNEQFVHYLWLTQAFSKEMLLCDTGETVCIYNQGFENHNSGPDFGAAKIKIGDMVWNGNVEIHTRSSDWRRHRHHEDQAYDSVILHVVWAHDQQVTRTDGTVVPTIELKKRVSHNTLLNYRNLINKSGDIACSDQLPDLDKMILFNLLDRMAINKLQDKVGAIEGLLKLSKNNWEETAFLLLCNNLGFKVNSAPFSLLGRSIPYNLLRKYRSNLFQVEALLFGAAGFLDDYLNDPYHTRLRTEHHFLVKKHGYDTVLEKTQWKFHRLRPANFPTIRIAQLASIIHHNHNLFSLLLNTNNFRELQQPFSYPPSSYWLSHYNFGKPSKKVNSTLGKAGLENIIINTLSPLVFTYGQRTENKRFCEKAVNLLQGIPAENNRIIRKWNTHLGSPCKTAFDSQALIFLYNNYCINKKCLACDIGKTLLKK